MAVNTAGPERNKRMDRAILFALAGGILTVAVGIWIAFEAQTPTFVQVSPSGMILVEGPEASLIGVLRANDDGHILEVRGLPAPETIRDYPEARRAICRARDNPAASWEEPSATLRAHLHSEKFEALCQAYATT